MSNIEIVIEKVTINHDGKNVVFKICVTDERNVPRAYIGDTSKYYDIKKFNEVLAKLPEGSVKREQVADVFTTPHSGVIGHGIYSYTNSPRK